MGFFKFIKSLFGKKEVKPVDTVAKPLVETPVVPVELKGYQGVVETPVEKAEVEKMSERLKDVTTSKPLTKIEPTEEKTISVKEIKARKKVVKTKSEASTEVPVEKPKAKKPKKSKKD
jgi:hypothetical protein